MVRRPLISRIGESTQGVYSDILVRSLPNGWRFGLPNEVFLTEQGRHYEASGVPPDIRAPVFPKQDLAEGRDSALEMALETLFGPARSPTAFGKFPPCFDRTFAGGYRLKRWDSSEE